MRFVTGYDDAGRPLPLDDPLAGEIRAALAGNGRRDGGSPAAVAGALLGLEQVFSPGLAADPVVRELIVHWLADLTRHGVAGTLSAVGAGR
jgi:fructuronate reductase